MPLSAKSRLGPYEILAPIGAGGMGEVYKARDTRLDRIVAVKISSEKFSERFGREARAVAALNHPNICTLHDVGPDYLVMEYIEGHVLKGPLPPETALKYALQICDALDAAHRKGVIHRDLKPANILVTKAGIKLLDFGLAKMNGNPVVGEATETLELTKEHTVLGTLQYMSPEQLEGKPADARSDIFSFGVVLYELLTGKRPFQGTSQASLIAAILERDPPSVANVAPGYSAALGGKTRTALLRLDSSALYVPPGYLLWVEGDGLQGQAFDADRLMLAGQPFTVADGVGLASTFEGAMSASETGTLAYSGVSLLRSRPTWFDRTGNSEGSPLSDGDYVDFRMSPDAKRLAAAMVDPKSNGNADIWLIGLERRNTERLTASVGVNAAPLWSADGERVVFRTSRSGQMELYQRSAIGGGDEAVVLSAETQRTVGMGTLSLIPTDLSPDGRKILAQQPTIGSGFDIWLIPVGGNEKPVKFLGSASQTDEIHANFSPDGLLVAYSSNETGRHEVYVETFPRSNRRRQVSTDGGYEPRWRGDGREIYYLSGDRKLMAVPVRSGPSFGVPKALFQTQVAVGVDTFRTHYIAHPDGQRFLVNTQIADPSPKPITVVLNWTAGLKK